MGLRNGIRPIYEKSVWDRGSKKAKDSAKALKKEIIKILNGFNPNQ